MKKRNKLFQAGKKRAVISLFSGLFLLIILSIIFFPGETKAAPDLRNRCKCYASIEIQEGDTLWEIASDYMGEDYASKNDYIKDVKKINNMKSDKIIAGKYLIVPYYVDYETYVNNRHN